MVLFCFAMIFWGVDSTVAQDKTHSKKLEKVKKKKKKKNKDKKAAQFQGNIEPTASPSIKGNPTKTTRKTRGKSYQERIGAGEVPKRAKGTRFSGKRKAKTIEKSEGTRHRGDPAPDETRVKGNPTKKKGTSGAKYQERIGADGPPRGTKGTRFRGRSKSKEIKAGKGTNYKGETVPLETTRVKGNPTKKIDKRGKAYRERTGQQGPPTSTPGTRFSGSGRSKTIKGGNDGTTYDGESTAGSSSTSGRRTTIYGERGRNFQKDGVPEIKKQDQGADWKGNLKRSKSIEGTPGTQFKGNLKGNKSITGTPGTRFEGNLKGNKTITGTPGTTYRGNLKGNKVIEGTPGTTFKGNMKLTKTKPDRRASTYTIKGMRAKEISQGPGTTYRGNLKSSKKIVNWEGSDFEGHLKVKRNRKIKTEGTTYAGDLRVRPNAKTKTPGTTFAGHYRVKTNSRIKTEGTTFQGNFRKPTRFSMNQHYKKTSKEQQLFAGNYKVRRTKGKDLHPSAKYTGRLEDPNKKGGLSRKLKLFLAKTKKNANQPKHLKSKHKKPKYDPKESEIWYE